MSWDQNTDVVVVGSGAAAFTAAVTASAAGREVVMLEKAATLGGTTRRSGGTYWIPNNRFMRADEIDDPRDWAIRYMARLAYPVEYNSDHPTLGLAPNAYELISVFYDRGSEAVDYLETINALHSIHDPLQPDYAAELVENKAPRGRYLKPRPVNDLGVPTSIDGIGGEDLIAQLQAAAKRFGVKFLPQHEVRSCIRSESGAVVGVEVVTPKGSVRFAARRGVVFGSGGFLHNPQMRRDYLRGPIFGGCSVLSNTGDFVRIGMDLGTDLGNMSQAWWAEVILEDAIVNPSPLRSIWIPGGDAMVLVNKYGRRVVNEKSTYNERGQVHHFWDGGKREYSNLVLMLIYDDSVRLNPMAYPMRPPIPMPDANPRWQITGENLIELGAAIRSRLSTITAKTGGYQLDDSFDSGLVATVARFNGFAAAGKDDEFGRGETPIELYWGRVPRAENDKNPTMFPFAAQGPYHCILVAGGGIDTKGGPRTDADAHVLDRGGSVIPGLYGAGNCVASPTGQAYWAAGGTLGPAITFGYIAGLNVAAEPVRQVTPAVVGGADY